MGRPQRIVLPGASYYVTDQGNELKRIFETRSDIEKFLIYLEAALTRYRVKLHAYCLMPNHYHLLLQTTEEGNLADAMLSVKSTYTRHFNSIRKRTGHLFGGRYKAHLVEAENTLVELSRDVHLIPVRAGIVTKAEEYPWTSYPEYIGERGPQGWLTTEIIRSRFTTVQYREYVESGMQIDCCQTSMNSSAANLFEPPEFFKNMIDRQPDGHRAEKSTEHLRDVERIVLEVSSMFPDPRTARKVAIYLSHRLSAASLKELGTYFGKKESAISQVCRRLVGDLAADADLKKAIGLIEQRLGLKG